MNRTNRISRTRYCNLATCPCEYQLVMQPAGTSALIFPFEGTIQTYVGIARLPSTRTSRVGLLFERMTQPDDASTVRNGQPLPSQFAKAGEEIATVEATSPTTIFFIECSLPRRPDEAAPKIRKCQTPFREKITFAVGLRTLKSAVRKVRKVRLATRAEAVSTFRTSLIGSAGGVGAGECRFKD